MGMEEERVRQRGRRRTLRLPAAKNDWAAAAAAARR
jgi:hypothetical protein